MIKRRLSWLLKYWALKLAGKPRSMSVPLYHKDKLIAYEEFLLNQIGEVYIETFSDKWESKHRRIYLFDVKVLDENTKKEG